MPAKKYESKEQGRRAWKDRNRERWSREDPWSIPGTKYCTTCRSDRPRTAFPRAYTAGDGLQSRCSDCIFTKHAEDPRIRMLSNAKLRAKQKGLEFSLEIDDIQVPAICPVLGLPLTVARGRKPGDAGAAPNSPTIDRIDNSRGYVKGNVRVISWRANDLKHDASVDELEAVLAYMKASAPLQFAPPRPASR